MSSKIFKKLAATMVVAAILSCAVIPASAAISTSELSQSVSVITYNPKLDYMAEISRAVDDGSTYALQMASVYEQMRNRKIEQEGLAYETTSFFRDANTPNEAVSALKDFLSPKPKYSQEDLDLLSHVVFAEVGADYIPDWVQRGAASVVLNRVASGKYPNNIHDVVYQPGQYQCTWDGSLSKNPNQRTIENVKWVLENGSTMPAGVNGMSSVAWGAIYATFDNPMPGEYDVIFFYA